MRKFTHYLLALGLFAIAGASYLHKKYPQTWKLYIVGLGLLALGVPCLYITRKLERRKAKEQSLYHTLASALGCNELVRPSTQWEGKGKERHAVGVESGYPPYVIINDNIYSKLRDGLAARLGGDVSISFDLKRCEVSISMRPDIPDLIMHPANLSTRSRSIPFGATHGDRILSWDPKEISHCLVIGMVNAGKTRTLIGMVIEAIRRKYRVIILDPKRTSFRGFTKRVPVHTENAAMAKAIDEVYEEMEKRYRDLRDHKVFHEDLKPILVVVDEFSELDARLREEMGSKKDPPAILKFRQLVRLGREAGIHLLVGLQRPDASILTGETRSNFGLIIALGKLSPHARQMVAPGSSMRVSKHTPGRALAIYLDDEIETQIFLTPDPAGKLTKEDERLLTELLAEAPVNGSRGRSPKPSQARTPSSQGGSPGDSQSGTPPSGLPEKLTSEKVALIEELAGDVELRYSDIAERAGVSVGVAHKYGSPIRKRLAMRSVGAENGTED